jgi:hypothetical protein
MTEVGVDGWAPIRNRLLGPALLDAANYGSESEFRTTRDGLAYFCPHVAWFAGASLQTITVRPRLRPTDLYGQLRFILRKHGWDCRPSDKGLYASESAVLFGGFASLAKALQTAAVCAVLAAFRGRGDLGLSLNDRRRYLALADIHNAVGDSGEADATLEEMEGNRVVSRGVVLKCNRCRSTSWYRLADVAETFSCHRCYLRQRPTRESWLMTVEPIWYYRLAEVVFQLLESDGELPIVASARAFSSERLAVDQSFELEFFGPGGEHSEHDIAVSFGHQLWLGEATKSDRLASSSSAQLLRLQKLLAVASVLDAYGVTLVTSQPALWQQLVNQASSTELFGSGWPRLRLETEVDLLPLGP